MKSTSDASNPFYNLLVVVGVAFVLTATAYCVMAVRQQAATPGPPEPGLVEFMDHYGLRLMLCELGVLAVAAVAAMLTDGYWTRRAARRQSRATGGADSETKPVPRSERETTEH